MLTFSNAAFASETKTHQLDSNAIAINPATQKLVLKAKFKSVGSELSYAAFGILNFKDDQDIGISYVGSAFQPSKDDWEEKEGTIEGVSDDTTNSMTFNPEANSFKMTVIANYDDKDGQIMMWKDCNYEIVDI